jgi:hypothetical protein
MLAQYNNGSPGTTDDYTIAQLNTFTGSGGNYDADPKFVDADAGDFRLEPDSPLEGGFDEDVPLLATPAWDEYDQLTTLCGT